MKLVYASLISTLFVSHVLVTSATAEETRPLKYADQETQLCSQAIASQIKQKYGRGANLVLYTDQLQAYFISNGGIEGVRGKGMVKGLANVPQIGFDCVVDTGNKRIQKASMTVLSANPQDSTSQSVAYDSPAGQACVKAIDLRIKGIYGRTTQLVYDASPFKVTGQTRKSKTFGGRGMVKNLRTVPQVKFSCTVANNSNRVTSISLKIKR
jgi:hypothetical protein